MAQASIGPSATTHPTLADWASRLDPNGEIAAVVELMSQMNEILDDAVWLEGNLATGHRTTIRTGIPSGTWRRLNYGVSPSKSRTQQITDASGMLEDYSEVDKELAMLNGNTAEFRLSEDVATIEGLNQTLATTLIYGDTNTDPEKFMGLAPRYASLGDPSSLGTTYGNHIIGAGGTGSDLSSIWLIVWGANTCHMFFPRGSKAGLSKKDLGEVTLYDVDGGRFQGFRTHYQFKAGLCVRDWRYVVRIANLESAAITSNVERYMIQAINRIPNLRMGRPVFYCNRAIKTWLDISAQAKTNVQLKIQDWGGRPVTTFWGIPIRQVDAILNTESALT